MMNGSAPFLFFRLLSLFPSSEILLRGALAESNAPAESQQSCNCQVICKWSGKAERPRPPLPPHHDRRRRRSNFIPGDRVYIYIGKVAHASLIRIQLFFFFFFIPFFIFLCRQTRRRRDKNNARETREWERYYWPYTNPDLIFVLCSPSAIVFQIFLYSVYQFLCHLAVQQSTEKERKTNKKRWREWKTVWKKKSIWVKRNICSTSSLSGGGIEGKKKRKEQVFRFHPLRSLSADVLVMDDNRSFRSSSKTVSLVVKQAKRTSRRPLIVDGGYVSLSFFLSYCLIGTVDLRWLRALKKSGSATDGSRTAGAVANANRNALLSLKTENENTKYSVRVSLPTLRLSHSSFFLHFFSYFLTARKWNIFPKLSLLSLSIFPPSRIN